MEKAQLQRESQADVKAAERMGRLCDLILEENPIENDSQRHALNVFFTRVLFCYFAEDIDIFPPGIFVNGVASHTSEDGSDLQSYLTKLFKVLNTQDRENCPNFLIDYPYVNGGLFATESAVPRFNARARKILIECGALSWKAINPDIFGSMMQAVVHTDERSGKGMHYTSVVNIMKVIEPLFLNELRTQLESAGSSKQKLEKLLERIYNIRIFDPACGSGNFLIIAYKELCKLEIEIFKLLNPDGQISFRFQSKLKLSQFYGIEIDNFAHETAKLSLWLTQHQMNMAFKDVFGETRPTFPPRDSGNLVCGNATRLNWNEICPSSGGAEVYILGNPPYVGFQNQNEEQKKDIQLVFKDLKNFGRIDYVGCWVKKSAEYLQDEPGAVALIMTNSVCQGEQVSILWPHIFAQDLEIHFAHQPFSWGNNARNQAKVTCIIVGLQKKKFIKSKILFKEGLQQIVKNISPYLLDSETVIVRPRQTPLSAISAMGIGNVPLDGNNFILTSDERNQMIKEFPESLPFIKKYMGASDFMQGKLRYCIWVTDETKHDALMIKPIKTRIDKCRVFRSQAGVVARQHVEVAHRFRTHPHRSSQSIIFPKTTSSRRRYVPAGFLNSDTIISEKALAAYEVEPYMFGILSSAMHMVWMGATSSRMRMDYQYSVKFTYNTFPLPKLTKEAVEEITDRVFAIIDEREKHAEKTLAALYDVGKMPSMLLREHQLLDATVEKCYRAKPFFHDEERLEHLFALYQEMVKTNGREPVVWEKEEKRLTGLRKV